LWPFRDPERWTSVAFMTFMIKEPSFKSTEIPFVREHSLTKKNWAQPDETHIRWSP
jgi:hypothetical protein